MKSVLQVCLAALNAAALFIWRAVRPVLGLVLQVLAALILIFEEWGWRPLSSALAWLARFRPWARLELAIAGLPPYAALAAIALPTTLLFPLKFVAIWLVANGHLVTAAALFIAAKVVSTALIARVFMLVKPALMQIGWFADLYERFVPWKEAIFAKIRTTWVWRYGRMLKTAARHRDQTSLGPLAPRPGRRSDPHEVSASRPMAQDPAAPATRVDAHAPQRPPPLGPHRELAN